MKWGAHEADGRIAAINAKKIRAALRQGIDAKRIFQMYLATHPATSKNPTQDRARARAWAKLNMRINNEPLLEVLQRVWADGYVLGQVSADQAISEAREARKADVKNQVDWSSWKPGDLATAQLLRPSKAFQELLGRARVTINGFDSTTYERVGTALADAIEAGMSETGAAKLINNAISNPARALTIAITEQNRAMSYGAIQRYKESAIERVEWQTINPCKECERNSGQIVEIGHAFNSGSEMPPQHPHCRCALLPVLPDFETNEHGVVTVEPPKTEPAPKLTVAEKLEQEYAHERGNWSKPQQGEKAVAAIEDQRRKKTNVRENKRYTDKGWENNERAKYQLDADRKMAEGCVVYTNGWTTVIVKETDILKMPGGIDALLDEIDNNMEKSPIKFLTVKVSDSDLDEIYKHYAPEKRKRIAAAANRGSLLGSNMWVRPATVDTALNNPRNSNWNSAVPATTTKIKYTITHEWGHLREQIATPTMRDIESADKVINEIVEKNGKAFLSEYGKSNAAEAYAESWADWVLNNGKTDNPITNAMAKEYGWK